MTGPRWLRPALIVVALASGAIAGTPEPADLLRLRSDLDQLAKPYLITQGDVAVHLAPSLFTTLSTALSSLPAEKRRISFDGESRVGYVWRTGGGVLGCGGYAEINDEGRNFHFVVDIRSLNAAWQPDGTLLVKLDLGFAGSGNVHGHANGPAGPCSLLRLAPTCDCPIGGGVGSIAGFTVK